jgi:hypothetical protein
MAAASSSQPANGSVTHPEIHAEMLATVATLTQPRYRPTVPSVTRASAHPDACDACSSRSIRISTSSRATMTTTLPATSPSCTLQIHAAFSSAEAMAHGRSARCRSDRRAAGKSCQTA